MAILKDKDTEYNLNEEKVRSFMDDIRYLCECYGYKYAHEEEYRQEKNYATMKTDVVVITTIKVMMR